MISKNTNASKFLAGAGESRARRVGGRIKNKACPGGVKTPHSCVNLQLCGRGWLPERLVLESKHLVPGRVPAWPQLPREQLELGQSAPRLLLLKLRRSRRGCQRTHRTRLRTHRRARCRRARLRSRCLRARCLRTRLRACLCLGACRQREGEWAQQRAERRLMRVAQRHAADDAPRRQRRRRAWSGEG